MRLPQLPLLAKVAIAILLGIGAGFILPDGISSIFITFNSLFSNFLGFVVPMLILGLVMPGIADLGKGAGRLLLLTAVLAYSFTVISGFLSYFSCEAIFPLFIQSGGAIHLLEAEGTALKPFFTINMPPIMGVMTALITAFTLGLGLTVIAGDSLKKVMNDFRDIIIWLINHCIIPLLPLYIFGVFLNITSTGQVAALMAMFLKIIVVIFLLTFVLLLLQFTIAGLIARKNPLTLLKTMMPAYFTALGTQSSAAAIPVTLAQTIKNGVEPNLAGFVVPLCATIHLSGSTLKIVACAMAIMLSQGMNVDIMSFSGFIMMLGIAMVAAPGVPGGAIMASVGLLQSMLGFDDSAVALMIALYIAMDSFGTACNVTGDCVIAIIVNKIYRA